MRIYCFPYAGGNAHLFCKWRKLLPEYKVIPIELAGRGLKDKELYYVNFCELITRVFDEIYNENNDEEFALWGHSLGALIAFEIARKFQNSEQEGLLKHIFVSGSEAPIKKKITVSVRTLSDLQLKLKIIQLGGLPGNFFENKKLINYFLPILRKDLEVIETYCYKAVAPIETNITVFHGEYDLIVDKNDIWEWKKETNGNCNYYIFKGDHFFINQYLTEIMSIIRQTLR